MNCSINETALAIALRQGAATDLFKALQIELNKHFKIKLLTFSQIDMTQLKTKRIYSSDDSSYAIGGLKPIETNMWTKHVIEQQKTFIAHKHSELAKVFFDHVLIAQLGLGSVINWPVIVNTQVIGTVNFLAEEGAYLNIDLLALEKLSSWLTIPFLFELISKE